MTSSDLAVPVHSGQKLISLHVIILSPSDLSTAEGSNRLQNLSRAVHPANTIDVVMLVHDHPDPGKILQAIMQLQSLYVLTRVLEPI